MAEINLEYLPYEEFKKLTPKQIIKMIKTKNKILIIPKKLKPEEEARLIEEAMNLVDADKFKGIEIASITKEAEKGVWRFLKKFKQQDGITLIGNAEAIKEIKSRKGYAILKV
ncbi:MAG: DUF2073 domain-containing protein [Candidatus Nanohaloarchaeota archaeon]|nr:DUF2073 domain-containing protein [Candidatus Nanohaloarchaeota archaeon]